MVLKVLDSSLPSRVDNLYASDLVASTTTYGPNQLGSNLPLVSLFVVVLLIFSLSTRSPILNSLDFIFLRNSLLILAWYPF